VITRLYERKTISSTVEYLLVDAAKLNFATYFNTVIKELYYFLLLELPKHQEQPMELNKRRKKEETTFFSRSSLVSYQPSSYTSSTQAGSNNG
jgi:hypothetical protein